MSIYIWCAVPSMQEATYEGGTKAKILLPYDACLGGNAKGCAWQLVCLAFHGMLFSMSSSCQLSLLLLLASLFLPCLPAFFSSVVRGGTDKVVCTSLCCLLVLLV